jgi:hypothetical protein
MVRERRTVATGVKRARQASFDPKYAQKVEQIRKAFSKQRDMRTHDLAGLRRVAVSEVLFSIDLRHPDNAIIDEMDCKIRHIVEAECGLAACKLP